MNEVNVKSLKFVEGSDVLVKKVKCNFRTMGKKFGKLMKGIAAQIGALTQAQITEFEHNGYIDLDVEGNAVKVELSDVEIISEDIPGWLVSNEGNLTVALEIELTDELKREGIARELVNRIQNMRKDNAYEITDRINVVVSSDANTDAAISQYADYIKSQVLADSITIADNDGVVVDFDEYKLNIKIEKAKG